MSQCSCDKKMNSKSFILLSIIFFTFLAIGKPEQTFGYPPLVALKIDDETKTRIHIFKKNIITTSHWYRFWGRVSTKCQFYKDTFNGNDFYLIFIDDNSMQWQIFSNLTEGLFSLHGK